MYKFRVTWYDDASGAAIVRDISLDNDMMVNIALDQMHGTRVYDIVKEQYAQVELC